MGGNASYSSTGHLPEQAAQGNVASPTHAFQGVTRLRKHRQLPRQRHLSLSRRASIATGEGPLRSHGRSRPCGFDSLTTGAVACQFLWDSEQQLLLVCHTGDVRAILAHPAQDRPKKDQPSLQEVGGQELAHFTAAAVAAGKHFQQQQSVSNTWRIDSSRGLLGHSYDCVMLTREHSTLDCDERKRVQGAGKPRQRARLHIYVPSSRHSWTWNDRNRARGISNFPV